VINHTCCGLGLVKGSPPKNLLLVSRYVIQNWPSNLSAIVLVGARTFTQSTFDILKKIYRAMPPVHFADDEEGAHALIEQILAKKG
jgi:hypothetical protein